MVFLFCTFTLLAIGTGWVAHAEWCQLIAEKEARR
jgi:hypothetical protein